MRKYSDKDLFDRLKSGETSLLVEIYQRYGAEWISWSKFKYKVANEVAEDVFQESVIVFYSNIKSGKLTVLTSSVKTYLFAIAKRKMANAVRDYRFDYVDLEVEIEGVEMFNDPFVLSDEKQKIAQALAKLGEPCNQLLQLFYFEENSTEAIANKMDYKNEEVVSTQKLRCLKKLRQLWKTIENY